MNTTLSWKTALKCSLLLFLPLGGLAAATPILEPIVWPPAQAYAACEQKRAGDAVIMEIGDGRSVQAVCQSFNHDLVAKPVIEPGAAEARAGK